MQLIQHKREIKSFVKRQRKLSTLQQFAYTAASRYRLPADCIIDCREIFQNSHPVICEIGFGDGGNLIHHARLQPQCNFIGIEVHKPGVAEVMHRILEFQLENIRIVESDAVTLFNNIIMDQSLSRIHIYFPDPWPKKRHNKRRIVQPDFAAVLQQKLGDHGFIHCATDCEDYAKQMMSVFSLTEGLHNAYGINTFIDNKKLQLRHETRFEKKGLAAKHLIWDMLFVKS